MKLMEMGVIMSAIVFLIFSSCFSDPNAKLTTEGDFGLVAYYPFNGNAKDESGNGNHGSVRGAKLTSDRFGNPNSAYDFNGKNAYIVTPVDINISKMPELTMSVWVFPRRTGPGDERVVNRGRRQIFSCDDGDFDRSLMVRYGYWEIFMGGDQWDSWVPVDIKAWQHVAVVFDTHQVKLYKNGNIHSSTLWSGSGYSTYKLTIGDIPSPHRQFFDGLIDDVRIYNRALSNSDIQKIYNESKSVPAGVASSAKNGEEEAGISDTERQTAAKSVVPSPEKLDQESSTPTKDQLKAEDKTDFSELIIITVLDFAIENIPQNEGKIIVDMIGSEIFHTRKFRVIDRTRRETILEEIEFSYADCTDIGCQLELGKLLAANYIVVGSLAQVASRYLISTKLIDVETGETISTSHDVYQSLDDLIDSIGDVVETLSNF